MLTDQPGLPHIRITFPLAKEQLTQERVQRLLLTSQLLATTTVLLVKSSKEPLQDQQSPLLGIGLLSRGHENGGVFGPVGGVLGEGGCGQDEGRSCQGRQITVEGGDGLENRLMYEVQELKNEYNRPRGPTLTKLVHEPLLAAGTALWGSLDDITGKEWSFLRKY